MNVYRVYLVGLSGHFEGVEVLHCASDAEALFVARRTMLAFPKAEVWSGARRIGEVVRDQASAQVPPPLPDLAATEGARGLA